MLKRRFGSKAGRTDGRFGRSAGSDDPNGASDPQSRGTQSRDSTKALRGGWRRELPVNARDAAELDGRAADVDAAAVRESQTPSSEDRRVRLEQARALLMQAASIREGNAPSRNATSKPAVETPTLATNRAQNASPLASRIANPNQSSAIDAFEDADPFEPFEQCTPDVGVNTASESVYSRSSQRARKTSAAEVKDSKRPQRSLKGRALAYLSRREYSRAELSRKLRPYVEEADSLETLLDSLERDGWLSNERFVESVVHRRAARMGGSRIIHELKRHAVGETLIGETADKLAQTETARAQSVWERKYGVVPETPAERAKQARFLAARGFSMSTISKVLKGSDEDWTDEVIDD
jgi:regulatory protein